ncbi:hypothetical protein EWB00_000832, partial [Schistosoma japonicum]
MRSFWPRPFLCLTEARKADSASPTHKTSPPGVPASSGKRGTPAVEPFLPLSFLSHSSFTFATSLEPSQQ